MFVVSNAQLNRNTRTSDSQNNLCSHLTELKIMDISASIST